MKLLFSSRREGNLDVYVMDVDGDNVKRLTNHPGDDFNAVWQPATNPQADPPHLSIAFEKSAQEFTSGETFQVGLGDLDGDGDLDVFVANTDRPNEVWLNEDGELIDSGLRLGENMDLSGKPSLGDLDRDGDLDVAIGRFQGGAEIWFNLGSSELTSHP